jgi:hypothetical protein
MNFDGGIRQRSEVGGRRLKEARERMKEEGRWMKR